LETKTNELSETVQKVGASMYGSTGSPSDQGQQTGSEAPSGESATQEEKPGEEKKEEKKDGKVEEGQVVS